LDFLDLAIRLKIHFSTEITGTMPVFSDPNYIADIHKELRDGSPWKLPGLQAVVQFAWGVMLRQLSQYPIAAGLLTFMLIEIDKLFY